MPFRYAHIVPLVQAIVYSSTFITTYVLAVWVKKDVPNSFPYISDTGIRSIERCIFTFGVGLGSLSMILVLCIRYWQVKELLEKPKGNCFSPRLVALNKAAIYLGTTSVVGVYILGCFQAHPYLLIHFLGAALAFSTGWLSLVIQTYVSFKIYPQLGRRSLNVFRAILTAVIGLALVGLGVCGSWAYFLFHGNDISQWTEHSGGFRLHLASVFAEWILVLGVVFYLTLYTSEFKCLVLHRPIVDVVAA